MLMSLMFPTNITGEYIMWINILTVGCLCEIVHGFYSYYRPVMVTASGIGAAMGGAPIGTGGHDPPLLEAKGTGAT